MAEYDLESARKAGVSDGEIANALAPKLNYDLEGARKAGVSDKEIAEALTSKFNSTPGGAATGNPSITNKSRPSLGNGRDLTPFADIGAATAVGGGLGAASKEILTGAGNVIGSFPYPAARTVGGFLKGAGQIIGAGGRAAPAATGALSGAIGETAGQAADVAFPDSVAIPEATRFIAGGIGPETGKIVPWALKKIGSPAATVSEIVDFLRRVTGKEANLSAEQKAYLEQQIGEIRGGAKTNDPLEKVGSLMGERGRNLMDLGDQQLIAAQQRAAGVQAPGQGRELADIGGDLRTQITKRNQAAIDARAAQYANTEKARDALVAGREGAGSYVNSLPEYQGIIDSLKSQLDNSEAMKRSPDVQRSIQKVLSELQSGETIPGDKKLVQNGLNLDLQETAGTPKPTTFQAIDDVRRKLGELFKGKPAEGYEALNDARGRELYAQLTDLQKKFTGGDTGPHAKLLEDYHAQSEALAPFRSKMGKKATALDQYQEGQFASDASTLPASYFKTRVSVQALNELTGDKNKVNAAALDFANKELAGKDAAGVRQWLGKNSEWLAETGPTRTIIDRYATKLEGVERSLKNAQDFAEQAAKDNTMLTRNALPAQRAVDLIKSGDTELWSKAIPAITQSTQAKVQMVNAVRQVVADQASAKATGDLFSRNIRPFLEQSGIASVAEMEHITQRLANIQAMNVPEAERLGIAKRVILQAAGAWASSAAARAGEKSYQWSKENMVPQ